MADDPGWTTGEANKTVYDHVSSKTDERWGTASGLATSYMTKLEAYLAAIEAKITASTPEAVEFEPELVDMGDFEKKEFGAEADDFGDAPSEISINTEVGTISASTKTIADLPAVPSGSFTEPAYSSTIYTSLGAWILAQIAAGGTGLSAEVEAAIFARARARQQALNERAYSEASTFWAARGFNLPTGMLAAKIQEICVEQTRADALLSGEIMIKQAELAQANTQFIIKTAAELENTLRQYSAQVAQRLLESVKLAVDAGVQISRLELERVTAESKLQSDDIERQKVSLLALIEGEKLRVENYASQIQAYNGRIDAICKKFGIQVEAFKAEVEANNANLDATVKISGINAELQSKVATVELANKEIELKSILSAADRAINAEQEGAKLAATVVHSALTAVSISLSEGYSGSAGQSYDYNVSATD